MGPVERTRIAERMRAFYEPAWFGQESSFDAPLGRAMPIPTTMGGFQYDAAFPVSGMPGGGFTVPQGTIDDFLQRRVMDAPPIGQANLNRYGVGQLKNYGVGALPAYGTRIREGALRWR